MMMEPVVVPAVMTCGEPALRVTLITPGWRHTRRGRRVSYV